MDIAIVKDIVIGAAAVLAAALAIWNFIQSPSKANALAISNLVTRVDAAVARVEERVGGVSTKFDGVVERLDQELEGHERRILALEGEMKHIPTKDSVQGLRNTISDLNGTVGRIDERMTAVVRIVDRMDTYLRKDDGK